MGGISNMKTDVLEFQNMMNDFVFVSTIQISLTFKGNQTFWFSTRPNIGIGIGIGSIGMGIIIGIGIQIGIGIGFIGKGISIG